MSECLLDCAFPRRRPAARGVFPDVSPVADAREPLTARQRRTRVVVIAIVIAVILAILIMHMTGAMPKTGF